MRENRSLRNLVLRDDETSGIKRKMGLIKKSQRETERRDYPANRQWNLMPSQEIKQTDFYWSNKF